MKANQPPELIGVAKNPVSDGIFTLLYDADVTTKQRS